MSARKRLPVLMPHSHAVTTKDVLCVETSLPNKNLKKVHVAYNKVGRKLNKCIFISYLRTHNIYTKNMCFKSEYIGVTLMVTSWLAVVCHWYVPIQVCTVNNFHISDAIEMSLDVSSTLSVNVQDISFIHSHSCIAELFALEICFEAGKLGIILHIKLQSSSLLCNPESRHQFVV